MGFLTEKRRLVVQALIDHGSIPEAAQVLGIQESTFKRRLYGLKHSYQGNKRDCVEYEKFKLRLGKYL